MELNPLHQGPLLQIPELANAATKVTKAMGKTSSLIIFSASLGRCNASLDTQSHGIITDSFHQSFELIYDCTNQLAYDTLRVPIDVPQRETWNGTVCRAFLKMDLQWFTEPIVIVVHNVFEVHAHGGHRRINSDYGIS